MDITKTLVMAEMLRLIQDVLRDQNVLEMTYHKSFGQIEVQFTKETFPFPKEVPTKVLRKPGATVERHELTINGVCMFYLKTDEEAKADVVQ